MTQITYVSTRQQHMWNGPIRYISVTLYDTLAQLQARSKKQHKDPYWYTVQGFFTPIYRREFFDGKNWVEKTNKHYAGGMVLCKERLDMDVISHECFHAACAIYRLDCHPSINLYKNDDHNINEENLAYILGDLTDGVAHALLNYTPRRIE